MDTYTWLIKGDEVEQKITGSLIHLDFMKSWTHSKDTYQLVTITRKKYNNRAITKHEVEEWVRGNVPLDTFYHDWIGSF